MNTKKRVIRENAGYVFRHEISDKSLNDIIHFLLSTRDNLAKLGYTEVSLEDDSHSDLEGWYLMGHRLETDEEFEARLLKAEKARVTKLANAQSTLEKKWLDLERKELELQKEREEFERLKKELEGK